MIEVFRTNVTKATQANMLVEEIQKAFRDYTANFDLHDCDNILRVKSSTGAVQPGWLVDLLKDFGFFAEVLPDIPSMGGSATFIHRFLKFIN